CLHINYKLTGIKKVFLLSPGELILHFVIITLNNGPVKLVPDADLFKVGFFLAYRRQIGAHHVTYVADEITGHDRIKINNTNTVALFIKQYIADLGIVVGNAKPEVRIGNDIIILGYNIRMRYKGFYQRV